MIDYNIDYLRCLHNQAGQGREREEKASVKAFVESCKGGGGGCFGLVWDFLCSLCVHVVYGARLRNCIGNLQLL